MTQIEQDQPLNQNGPDKQISRQDHDENYVYYKGSYGQISGEQGKTDEEEYFKKLSLKNIFIIIAIIIAVLVFQYLVSGQTSQRKLTKNEEYPNQKSEPVKQTIQMPSLQKNNQNPSLQKANQKLSQQNKNNPESQYIIKGNKYIFDKKVSEMVESLDMDQVFGKKKQHKGIKRSQFIDAVLRLQLTHNLAFGGAVKVQQTAYDTDIYEKNTRINNLVLQERRYYESVYKLSEYRDNELRFCIIVPSANFIQSGYYLRNLDSIFQQDYNNYHVVFIDDASTDNTSKIVDMYKKGRKIPDDKMQIITNKESRKPVFNVYNGITNYCRSGEVVIVIRGQDALIGTNVFKLHNAIYQRDKCAMTYSSYLDIKDNSKAELLIADQLQQKDYVKGSIRSLKKPPGKFLMSFYVDVFKSIKEEDFKDHKGYFFWFALEQILMVPLLQISFPRISVIKEILYEHRRDYGWENLDDNDREAGEVFKKDSYNPLKFFFFIEKNKYKYNFDSSTKEMIQNSDYSAFANEDQSEGISLKKYKASIKLTELVHNVKFGGNVDVEMTSFDTDKQQKTRRIKQLLKQDFDLKERHYMISKFKENQLPFCIVTPSYNNVKSGLYLRNLDSIFMQDYENYHVVYIDDASPDKTGDFVNKYLEQKRIPKDLIQVIINKQNKKALANIHFAIHNKCQPGEIVAIIDGDDSFIGRNVLSMYNAVYQRLGSAMAYSSFLTIHNNDRGQLGFCHSINKDHFEQNSFRNSWDLPGTHLMSFYSDVFRKIKISDLTYENGTFFDYAYDRAIITPILEMTYPRIAVIKEITYEYRNDTGINDSPNDWIRLSHMILDKKPYDRLTQFPFIEGFIAQKDKFNFKTSIQSVIKNTKFQIYLQKPKYRSRISKDQHVHAIRMTDLVHFIDYKGNIDIQFVKKSSKNPKKKLKLIESLLNSNKEYFQKKYSLSQYQSKQLQFCIVVHSYNNVKNGLYLRNLDSILMQDYSNYQIVYIDDKSVDQVGQQVKKYIVQKNIPSDKIRIVVNQNSKGQLASIYQAAHEECQLGQIMFIVNGGDALIGRNVLSLLNALYQQTGAAMSYGCYLTVLNNNATELGKCQKVDSFYFQTNTLRNKVHRDMFHLISFYTDVFRRIRVGDLTYSNGTFFNNTADKAILIPLMQLSYPNILVVRQMLYEYRKDVSVESNIQGKQVLNLILSKPPYEALKDKAFTKKDDIVSQLNQQTNLDLLNKYTIE